MAKVFLDPKKFQEQIDKYDSDAANIKDVVYKPNEGELILKCIDKYLECITEFNAMVQQFGKLMDKDTSSMKQIRASWMKLDEDMADKTLGQLITGK